MTMIEGWLLDVHANETNTEMVAWIVDDFGVAHGCALPWKPTIHVHASHHSLDRLEYWLSQPELRQRFGIDSLLTTQARLNLETEGHVDVLAIALRSYQNMRALAEHIEARGIFIGSNFTRSMRIWPNAFSMITGACRLNEYAGLLPIHLGFKRSTKPRQRAMCSRRFTWFALLLNSPRGVSCSRRYG